MMIGSFEGIGSKRGIAWRVADSLTLRRFLRIGLDERTPDHVTISRTRRLIRTKRISRCRMGAEVVGARRTDERQNDRVQVDHARRKRGDEFDRTADTQQGYREYLKRVPEPRAPKQPMPQRRGRRECGTRNG